MVHMVDISNEAIELPPLRRMSHRNIADEMPRIRYRRRPDTPPAFNGLGDRRRSVSPHSEMDAWAIMGTSITPDPSLPSAEASFATVAGSFAHDTDPTSSEPGPGGQGDNTPLTIPGFRSPLYLTRDVGDQTVLPENCDLPSPTSSSSSAEDEAERTLRMSSQLVIPSPLTTALDEFEGEFLRFLDAEATLGLSLEQRRQTLGEMQRLMRRVAEEQGQESFGRNHVEQGTPL